MMVEQADESGSVARARSSARCFMAAPLMSMPPRVASSAADAAQLEGWFASCETIVAREFEAIRISELPAECRSNPVPQWMELDCKRKASLIEQRRGGLGRVPQRTGRTGRA